MGVMSQTVGLAAGWLAIAGVVMQAMVAGGRVVARRVRWQRNYVRERAGFVRQATAAAQVARATKAIPDWTGWRPFRVAAVVDETHDVKSFYLEPVDAQPLAPFLPGQYLTFHFSIPGRDTPLARCYSLSDRPRPDYYRVTIKRVAPPTNRPDLPPGRGSSYFHDHVRVGDVLEARAPAGTFFIDPQASQPIALIGAGIGITPLISMLETILHAGQSHDIYAMFGFRNSLDHAFKTHLEGLAAAHTSLRMHVSYSAPQASDTLYKDYSHYGRLSIERIREVLPSNNLRFYVCGPGGLMESLVPALWEWGVPESHVHFEAFGPASVRSACQPTQHVATRCEVQFTRTGRSATWDETSVSLLELGEAAGVALPSGCRAGSCGECLTAIRDGEVTLLKPAGIPIPAGHCLTCISVPTTNLTLDA